MQDLITTIQHFWRSATTIIAPHWQRRVRLLGIALSSLLFLSCSASGTFQAYEGAQRSDLQVAVLEGESYLRQDWLNRYVDSVRFHRVDDIEIQDSDNFERIEVAPGFHDIVVYFYWDLGNQRGLSQALVQYASTRESLSRTLRLNARAGESYTVRAEPVFNDGRRDITTLSHVNFWIEDSRGNIVVDRQAGRYRPQAL